jgi:hypothetical protein
MRLKHFIIPVLSAYCVGLRANSVPKEKELKVENILEIFAMNPKSEDDGSFDEMFERIPIYERNKVLIQIGNIGNKAYRTEKCNPVCDRYYAMYLDTWSWVNNTSFSKENKDLIRLLMKVHANAALGFDELYDLPLGVPLVGEGKTLLLHSKSKENDPSVQSEWSAKYGRKVWVIDEELTPGEHEINGEKVYIFSTKTGSTEESSPLISENVLAKNITPIIYALIDRNRCSELRDRFEYTFLSWNSPSMKEHLSSISAFSDPCYNSSIKGWERNGLVILTEKCDSNEKFLSLLSNMKNELSPCQLEYEYTTGKVWSFFLDYMPPPQSNFGLWPYYSDSVLMKMNPSGEIKNVLDGFRILSSLIPEAERIKEMWGEVRKIGVWEKVRVKATELFFEKKLKIRKYLFEGEPTKLDGIAKELMETIQKEKMEKEKLLHKKKTPHK